MPQRLTLALAAIFFAVILGLVLWFGKPAAPSVPPSDKIFVVTTIYPLQDFVDNVGGDHVFVTNIVPAGAEPHDYDPTPRDVTTMLDADVLVYVGAGLDTWAANLTGEITAHGGRVVGAEDVAETQSGDPHVWLDPVLAEKIVAAIRDSLVAADPDHAAEYVANAEAYLEKLQHLDQDYAAGLADCKLDDIIVSHDALGYLARRYHFTAHPISGLSPEAEPSVRDLADLSRTAHNLGVKTIFFETLVSPALAQTLANEVGADTAVLDPLEGVAPETLASGADYVSIMDSNLAALRAAMLCQ